MMTHLPLIPHYAFSVIRMIYCVRNPALRIACLICCAVSSLGLFAQNKDCGTPAPSAPIVIPEHALRSPMMLDPVMVKILVHVVADDNGTNRAAEDTSILRQLENMQTFYAPQDICFSLMSIRQINSTDLNSHNTETEEADLFDFLVADVINIFIHDALFNNQNTLNGSAYDIPNTYMSIVGSAIQSATNRSTTAHEMGHCLGLYHTFETQFGDEHVERTGGCANCALSGDFLCDTEADPHSDNYDTNNFIDANCNYFGTVTDACDEEYNMDPHNIMAYGRRACRDVLTNGQGTRMLILLDQNDQLNDCVAPGTLTLDPDNNTTHSSGWAIYTARNGLTVQGNSFTVNGSAHGEFTAGYIQINRAVHFNPGQSGYVHIRPNPLCE